MTRQRWTGSRFATLPAEHRPRRVHHCTTDDCCDHLIDAAEDARDWPDDFGADERAEREMGR